MHRRSVLKLPLALTLVAAVAGPAPAAAAVSYTPGDVHLVTATGDAYVAHTIRHADGSWDRFNPLYVPRSWAANLSSTVAGGEEHLVYQVPALPKPVVWDTYLRTRRLDGSWTEERLGFNSFFGSTAVAVVNGELHVVKRTDRTGAIEHRVRHVDGSWTAGPGIPAVGAGASLANVNGVLHLAVSDGDSNTVVRTMTWQGGTWSAPVDSGVLPQQDGRLADATIAKVGTEVHAVVRTADKGLWHAIRQPDGSFTGWGDIGGEAGVPGAAERLAVTPSRNTLHVAITTADGGLFHTIRFENGAWQRFGNVKGAAGDVPSREVTIAGE